MTSEGTRARKLLTALAATLLLVLSACGSTHPVAARSAVATTGAPSVVNSFAGSASPAVSAGTAATGAGGVPRFDHIVIVVLENKAYGQLIGAGAAPFLTGLAVTGALLTQSYAITHPSQPNYLALFSGSTQGLSSDSCPHQFNGPNLAASLIAAGDSFTGYSDSLPSDGFTGCSSGAYARKHNPWVDFPTLPASVNQPMTAFPADLSRLPSVAFVVPNLDNDMHDGTIAQADQWLSGHLGAYATWSRTHNSLLIMTTDEDDDTPVNRIATIFAGAHVRSGVYAEHTDHYGILRTVLASYQLVPFAGAATTPPVTTIWAP